MDTEKLSEFVDQQRWLLNNGLVPDSVKNQLFFYGSIVHNDVQAVEVKIRPDEKIVDYTIYINKSLLAKMNKYKALSTSTSLFGMWRFKRFLKKEGTLDFGNMLNAFVRDFCGQSWSTTVTILDFDEYVDTIGVESESGEISWQPDKLPD